MRKDSETSRLSPGFPRGERMVRVLHGLVPIAQCLPVSMDEHSHPCKKRKGGAGSGGKLEF